QIKCVITKQEMEENGIELGDFISNQEKTQSFIRDILTEACATLGMETNAKAYSVQMTVMPDGDVALLISPDAGNGGIATAIEELKKHLTDLQENMGGTATAQVPGGFNSASVPNAIDKKANQDELTTVYESTPLWAIVSDMDEAIRLCREMPKYEGITSSLYKYDNTYYICMNFKLNRRQVSGIILVVAEYAVQMFTETYDGAYIVEHGQLICEDCINVLSQI
ncbi:MAG: adaptor protein MecA, partial [Bacteroidaceae bacterium]|nr:adaptor protein MecA [Bacteroidaceae bacterium]